MSIRDSDKISLNHRQHSVPAVGRETNGGLVVSQDKAIIIITGYKARYSLSVVARPDESDGLLPTNG